MIFVLNTYASYNFDKCGNFVIKKLWTLSDGPTSGKWQNTYAKGEI